MSNAGRGLILSTKSYATGALQLPATQSDSDPDPSPLWVVGGEVPALKVRACRLFCVLASMAWGYRLYGSGFTSRESRVQALFLRPRRRVDRTRFMVRLLSSLGNGYSKKVCVEFKEQ